VKAQFESEVVYGSLKEDLAKKGVIFTDTDTAVREHPDLVREYFGTIIPPTTTSSPRSTRPSGRAVRSSTSPRA
jgi:Fe-S cluster assembly scaffold protein SufB